MPTFPYLPIPQSHLPLCPRQIALRSHVSIRESSARALTVRPPSLGCFGPVPARLAPPPIPQALSSTALPCRFLPHPVLPASRFSSHEFHLANLVACLL